MEQIKLLPYGVSDFIQLRKQNKYYVDKTMYIPMLEERGNFLFLIRPRRFGKSLFLNMLAAYYDSKRTDRFDELFGGLWIGLYPQRKQYLPILKKETQLLVVFDK